MTIKINLKEIITQFPFEINDVDKRDVSFNNFIGWNKLSREQLRTLKKIGKVIHNFSNEELTFDDENYWSKEAMIDFQKYPYFGCDIYNLKNTNLFYLVYLELGGHGVETRCRLIQKKLINLNSLENVMIELNTEETDLTNEI